MKKIDGFDYVIAEDGRIWSLRTGKLMSPVWRPDGYVGAHLWRDGKYHTKLVHRLLLQTYVPCDDKALVVNHKNFNKSDNRLENLEWVSQLDNIRHSNASRRNKTHTPLEVEIKIVELFMTTRSAVLAEMFGININTVIRIAKRHFSKEAIYSRKKKLYPYREPT